ncbi:MAG: protein kinase [Rhodospirillaceae bacterium]
MEQADISTLGKYEILGPLGKGAMGVVYKGRYPVIERFVALKTVRTDLLKAEDADATLAQIARFKREAQAAGRLSHPNIVAIYEYGEDGPVAFIAMEFIAGRDLKSYFDASERFDTKAIVRIMTEMLAALDYAHKHGIVHRDIKPANIMLTGSDAVKITDFGIARLESSNLTQAGTVMGTPSYMSPEQFMAQPVDARSDIFSAGAVFYQLLAGEKPFSGSLHAIMHRVLNADPEPPSVLNVQVPRAFDPVVAKAMAKRAEDRYQNAGEFARAIRDAADHRPSDPPAPQAGDDEATVIGDATVRAAAPALVRPPPPPAAVASLNPAPLRPDAPVPVKAGGKRLIIGGGAALLIALSVGGWWLMGEPGQSGQIEQLPKLTLRSPAALSKLQEREPRHLASLNALTSLRSALGGVPCSLLAVDARSEGVLAVTGVAADEASVRSQIATTAPAVLSSLSLSPISPALCGPLTVTGPLRQRNQTLPAPVSVQPGNPDGRYPSGQTLVVDVSAPGFPAYLQVDYFTLEGDVVHLFPNGAQRATRLAPGETQRLGDRTAGGQAWRIGPPFGRELVVAIASSKPLFSAPRPDTETTGHYVAALSEALNDANQAEGPAPVAAATVITTIPK